MNTPTVSVLLPNLNHLQFLQERTDSILNQTLQDWELIVVDSYSTDGSWEFFETLAGQDRRVKISQAPKGLYESWNRCLKQVTGDFVYIATSDDSMRPDALEKMVGALSEHPECEICDSQLDMVDQSGDSIPGIEDRLLIYRYLGELKDKKHIRRRPHDGLVYLTANPVYTSITQILFRRSLLERVGLFKTNWGSKCDYEWGIRASLSTNTVYLPDKLSTWLRHDQQATAQKASYPAHLARLEMAHSAIDSIQDFEFQGSSFKDQRDRWTEFLAFESLKDRVRYKEKGLTRLITNLKLWTGSGSRSARLWTEQFKKLLGNRKRENSYSELMRFEHSLKLRSLIELIP